MLKKIVSIVISIMIIGTGISLNGVTAYSAVSTSVSATSYTDSQGVNYSLNNENKIASVSDNSNNSAFNTLVIPEQVSVNGQDYQVTNIVDSAFYSCSSLTSIVILGSLTKISTSAFEDCSSLKSIVIPSNVTFIGSYAFEDCSSLESIVIPSSVTIIGDNSFKNCSSLKSIAIPSSVTFIGEPSLVMNGSAFVGCSSLTGINVDNNNENYSSEDGILFNKDKTKLIIYPEGNKQSSYTVPSSVTSIGDSAFVSCSSLTSITIPSSVTSIGITKEDRCDYLNTELGGEIENNSFQTDDGVVFYRTIATSTSTGTSAVGTVTATSTNGTVSQSTTTASGTNSATSTQTAGNLTAQATATSASTSTGTVATGTTSETSKTGDASLLPVLAMMAIGAIGMKKKGKRQVRSKR